jgi:hypothetical protein
MFRTEDRSAEDPPQDGLVTPTPTPTVSPSATPPATPKPKPTHPPQDGFAVANNRMTDQQAVSCARHITKL